MSFGVQALSVRYRGVPAVRGVSFDVAAGEALALVGHNGAGKSSTLLALAGGLPEAASSEGRFTGFGATIAVEALRRQRPQGVAIVPERDKVFTLLTVEENLRAAARPRAGDRIGIDDVYGFFPKLATRRATLAGNLSGGEQQMLAIGSALLGSPRLLLVDEPTLGLAVPVIETICERLRTLRREIGFALLVALAETTFVVELAERAAILDRGELLGAPRALDGNARERLEAELAGESVVADAAAAH